MKKILILSAACLSLAACTSESLVDQSASGTSGKEGPISFVMTQKNTTRAYTDMQNTGHYNFGVFAYKKTDMVNPVMKNYLVGYCDGDKGYEQNVGTTWGDQNGIEDGKSWWAYEGLGSAEYNGTYAGGALDAKFTSNNANQYLKYWDNAADYTCFYAYAPYINGTGTATYVDGTAQDATGADKYVLTIPNGTLTDGYDDPSLAEYMYASAKVLKANYGHDVALQFKRLNAKVNIKFWEDIPGYKVRIINLGNGHEGVKAAASIKETGKGNYGYKGGKYYTKNGVKIQFNNSGADITSTVKQFEGTLAQPTVTDGNNATTINFKSPTEAAIGENRYAAAQSPTTYYAIPKGDGANVLANGNSNFATDQACDADLALTGFTFHVSYELTAEDTGEKIVVKNATVHVPAEYANWKGNTKYTYIFKITQNTNGSTDPDNDTAIDPTNPEVPTTQALYPIVFDNCTVLDWDEVDGEWNISDDAKLSYHNITLKEGGSAAYSFSSLAAHELEITISNSDMHKASAIDYDAITLAGPSGAITLGDGTSGTWKYESTTDKGTLTVPAGASAGVYTITYTCPSGDINSNHPKTWTQKFVIGDTYEIKTHRDVIGTKWDDASAVAKLNITGKKNGADETLTSANLAIEYPDNFKSPDFNATQLAVLKDAVQISGTDVVVKNNALPGVYKVVYTIDEGSKVKVAEYKFTVVDYSLSLSHTTVFNTVSGTTVTGNQTADADHVYTVSGPTSFTANVTSGTANVVVPNNSPEGTYTVTYTVFGSAADKAVYTKTFEVKNTYKVTLSSSTIDYDKDWDGGASTYGSEFITITPWVNGVAKTSGTSTLKVKQGTTDVTDKFTLTDNNNGTYKLQVKPQTAVTGNYTVEFTENGVTSTVDFVVTH